MDKLPLPPSPEGVELRAALSGYYGTENYHRFGLYTTRVCTDGALALARKGGCFWLLDLIAASVESTRNLITTEQHRERFDSLSIWTLRVWSDRSFTLVCKMDSGEGEPVLFQHDGDFTDFPLAEQVLYCSLSEVGRRLVYVIYLPSEY